jgi:hypothetical protein
MNQHIQMLSAEEKHASGKAKQDIYQWETADTPGTLMLIGKNKLHVDHSYQRDSNNARAVNLAKNWSWIACGVITVADRDGQYFVIDGQHRVMAAKKRTDIDILPCIVFETKSINEESNGFFNANTNRRMPAIVDKWRSKLLSRDPSFIYLDNLLLIAGREPSKSAGPSTVACLGTLVKLEARNHNVLETIWPVVFEICRGSVLHEKILTGLFYIECNLPEGESITNKKYSNRLFQIAYDDLLASINKSTAYYSRGGEKVYAAGIIQAMNKGRSTNRIDLI